MIRMYGTTENGDGFVMRLGDYETLDDIVIHVGMFAPDTELSFVDMGDEGDIVFTKDQSQKEVGEK